MAWKISVLSLPSFEFSLSTFARTISPMRLSFELDISGATSLVEEVKEWGGSLSSAVTFMATAY